MKFSEVDLDLISRNELYIQKICKVLISTVICDASFKKMSNIGRAQRWVLTPWADDMIPGRRRDSKSYGVERRRA